MQNSNFRNITDLERISEVYLGLAARFMEVGIIVEIEGTMELHSELKEQVDEILHTLKDAPAPNGETLTKFVAMQAIVLRDLANAIVERNMIADDGGSSIVGGLKPKFNHREMKIALDYAKESRLLFKEAFGMSASLAKAEDRRRLASGGGNKVSLPEVAIPSEMLLELKKDILSEVETGIEEKVESELLSILGGSD